MNNKLLVTPLACLLVLSIACQGRKEEAAPKAPDPNAAVWSVFRGDPALSGTSAGPIPDRPVLLWSFETGSYVISSPVLGLGRAYIGSTDGKVYALGLSDGRKVWEYDTGDDIEASPLLLDGALYVGNLGGEFHAVDAESGEKKWSFKCRNSIYGSANAARVPGTDRTTVFVGSYDNRVYGFDAATGSLEWTYETDNFINGAPSTDGVHAVFGGCDELLHIVAVADGSKKGEVWAGSYIPGSAALSGNRAYLGHYDNKVVCIDLGEQKIVWEYEDPDHPGPFFSSPAVDGKRVVIGSRDRFLHCIDKETGAKVWEFETRDEIDGSPVIAGDRAVVGSIDGRLYAVRMADGGELWSYEIGAPLVGSPAVAGGFIVIGAEDGRIYAIGGKP